MSDTPRTDALCLKWRSHGDIYDLARTLERELGERESYAERITTAARAMIAAMDADYPDGNVARDRAALEGLRAALAENPMRADRAAQEDRAIESGNFPSQGDARVVGMHRCPRCMGTGGPLYAVAFINTGEDHTKHQQRLVDGRCEACGGTGKVDGATLERLALAEGQRRARVAMKISLHEGAKLRGIGSAELSAIEHAREKTSVVEPSEVATQSKNGQGECVEQPGGRSPSGVSIDAVKSAYVECIKARDLIAGHDPAFKHVSKAGALLYDAYEAWFRGEQSAIQGREG